MRKNASRNHRNVRNSILDCKKGNALSDGLIILVSIFVLLIFFAFSYSVYTDSYSDIQADLTNNESLALHSDYNTRIPQTLDSALVFAFVLLWAGAVILAFFIDTHPIFFILTMLLLIGVLIVGAILSNTYQDIIVDDTSLETSFPMMSFIMQHLVAFIVGVVISIVVALYAKTKL